MVTKACNGSWFSTQIQISAQAYKAKLFLVSLQQDDIRFCQNLCPFLEVEQKRLYYYMQRHLSHNYLMRLLTCQKQKKKSQMIPKKMTQGRQMQVGHQHLHKTTKTGLEQTEIFHFSQSFPLFRGANIKCYFGSMGKQNLFKTGLRFSKLLSYEFLCPPLGKPVSHQKCNHTFSSPNPLPEAYTCQLGLDSQEKRGTTGEERIFKKSFFGERKNSQNKDSEIGNFYVPSSFFLFSTC